MDFEKLRRIDPGEWRSIHDELYGKAFVTLHGDKRLRSGNELLLTGIEVDDAIEEAIEITMVKIDEVRTEKCLAPYVARTALNLARTRLRSKFAKKSVDFLIDSWEQKLEENQKSKESRGNRDRSVFTHQVTPNYLVHLAELDTIFQELCSQFQEKDVDLVWMDKVEKRKQKEIGAEYGEDAKGMSLEISRARERMKKAILGSTRAVEIIKELGLEDYLK